MIQSAKFISNAKAIAQLLFLIYEDSKQLTLRKEQKFQPGDLGQFKVVRCTGTLFHSLR